MATAPLRETLTTFLKDLRTEMILAFEELEGGEKFSRKGWEHHSGGGGEISLLRGKVFEKAAINWSGVSGPHFPTDEGAGPFFATGISLITHMKNPHAPTVHFNIRYMETETRSWFGGGYDLTPMGVPYPEDTSHFHQVAKKSLDPYGEDLYKQFSLRAKEYFYLPHRKKERGVGGIFFDHWSTGNFEQDLAMWKNVGNSFLHTILPIYQRRIHTPYSAEDIRNQHILRGHYAEFNLAYDQGTRFGFKSGGNPEAILCSMPPIATW